MCGEAACAWCPTWVRSFRFLRCRHGRRVRVQTATGAGSARAPTGGAGSAERSIRSGVGSVADCRSWAGGGEEQTDRPARPRDDVPRRRVDGGGEQRERGRIGTAFRCTGPPRQLRPWTPRPAFAWKDDSSAVNPAIAASHKPTAESAIRRGSSRGGGAASPLRRCRSRTASQSHPDRQRGHGERGEQRAACDHRQLGPGGLARERAASLGTSAYATARAPRTTSAHSAIHVLRELLSSHLSVKGAVTTFPSDLNCRNRRHVPGTGSSTPIVSFHRPWPHRSGSCSRPRWCSRACWRRTRACGSNRATRCGRRSRVRSRRSTA